MDFIKKRINLYSVSILVLSLLLLVFYFVVNYCGLKLNRESLGLNDRYIGISAFAMTFGS